MVDETPMRVLVGTDVESVADVAASLARYGERYTRRLFTPGEISDSGGTLAGFAERLAARFAAKEAVIKLLSPTDTIPRWRSIEVCTAPNGAPWLRLVDEAEDLARERHVSMISVSMSHGVGIGLATVVALTTT